MSGGMSQGLRKWMLAGAAGVAMIGSAGAEDTKQHFDIRSQDLSASLEAFGQQSNREILFNRDQTRGMTAPAVAGDYEPKAALAKLLAGSGLALRQINANTFVVEAGTPAGPRPTRLGDASQASPSGNQSELEEIVVTGTHIRNADPLSPITTIGHDDFLAQGYSRLDEAIVQLSQNFGDGVVPTSNANTGSGASASYNQGYSSGVNLRGLGAGTTLVLLNGERLPLASYGLSADISAIPVSSIDRVEILTDGASATYGSDAIGGVVNIITQKAFTGFETSARVTSISEGKTPNYGGYVLGGFDWKTGNLVLNYDYESDHPLYARNRPWAVGVPDPTTLLIGGTSSIAYASLRQSLGPQLDLTTNLIYAHRTFNEVTNFTFVGAAINPDHGHSDEVQSSVALDYGISDDWSAHLSGQYGYYHIADFQSYLFTPVYAFSDSNTYESPSAALRIDGTVVELPGGTVKTAIGGEIRRESLTDDAGHLARPAHRSVVSAYGELLVPLVGADNAVPLIQSLEGDVSARYDHYSDFGGTSNPKVAMKWGLTSDLTIHTSYGRSFRAPTLIELDQPTYGDVINVPDPSSSSGIRTALILEGGNSDLKPEKSTSVNAGFTYAPSYVDGLKIDVSYFDISYTSQILDLSSEGYYSNVITDQNQLGSLVNLNPTTAQINAGITSVNSARGLRIRSGSVTSIGAIAHIGFVNAAQSTVHGFDIDVRYAYPLGPGVLSVDWSSSIYSIYGRAITPHTAAFSVVNTTFHPPKFRTKLNVGWKSGGFGVNGRLNYVNSYENNISYSPPQPPCSTQTPCAISSWTTADLSFSYSTSADTGPSWSRGLRLALDVTNVLDAHPPIIDIGFPVIDYDATNANPLGRAFAVSVTKRW